MIYISLFPILASLLTKATSFTFETYGHRKILAHLILMNLLLFIIQLWIDEIIKIISMSKLYFGAQNLKDPKIVVSF
mgnify:CR=1 FL=1